MLRMRDQLKGLFFNFWILVLATVLTSVSLAEPSNKERLKMRQSMIEFVIKRLPPMLYGYANYLEKDLYHEEALNDYRLSFNWIYDRGRFAEFPVRYVSDSEFKVHNIDVNRLAINTGTEILIHADRLATANDFSMSLAIQLLLHEFNHLVTGVKDYPHRDKTSTLPITLEQKDRFTTRFVDYIRSKTWAATTPDQYRPERMQSYSIIELDEPKHYEHLFEQARSHDESANWNDRYLAFKQSDNDFSEDMSLKLVMKPKEHQAFSKSVDLMRAQHDNKYLLPYPKTQIQELSADAHGKFYARFAFEERVFDYDRGSILRLVQPQRWTRTLYNLSPGYQERPERAFSFRQVKTEASFTVENMTSKETEAYVTLKVNKGPQDLSEILKDSKVSVLARDANGNRFSFNAKVIHDKSGQLRVQYRMNQLVNLVVTEILIQKNMGSQQYQEISVRPQSLQKIDFGDKAQKFEATRIRRKKMDMFDFWMGTSDHTVNLRLPVDFKLVEGLTLEIRAPLEVTLSETRYERYPRYYQTVGYKVFLDRKKLDALYGTNNWQNELRIPLSHPGWGRQRIEGEPDGKDKDGFTKWGTRDKYIEDIGIRGITNAWIHLKSGENIKLEYEHEPVARIFDTLKKEWADRAKKHRYLEWRAKSCQAIHSR